MTTAYTDLRARAAADDLVLGLVLFGSVARGMGTGHSDVDVFVVVGADRGGWVTSRSAELEWRRSFPWSTSVTRAAR
ncbi:hypothetical protein Ari01nite_62490 [Paractinoplanes rishiriensis]|uniref:Polymerase nucleotidyl transferase domain-containing protein n=1 Tax=Paractinoplanes rishiriensis TaxID=1050105 RepID=A0A919MXN4_9ACTN|nr:hypothetical protein Ari01nite_62490 [Actinoplanes rishiriensis]